MEKKTKDLINKFAEKYNKFESVRFNFVDETVNNLLKLEDVKSYSNEQKEEIFAIILFLNSLFGLDENQSNFVDMLITGFDILYEELGEDNCNEIVKQFIDYKSSLPTYKVGFITPEMN